MITYIPEYMGWTIEARLMADKKWGYALGTERFSGSFPSAARALAWGKREAERRDRRSFERRVREALELVGIGHFDWRWIRGRDALILPHEPGPLGLRGAEDAEMALGAYTESGDGDVEAVRVRGGTRFEFTRYSPKGKRLPARRKGGDHAEA